MTECDIYVFGSFNDAGDETVVLWCNTCADEIVSMANEMPLAVVKHSSKGHKQVVANARKARKKYDKEQRQ